MTRTLAAGRKTVEFGNSAVSRYIQLTTLFRRRIESGQWPVNQQIPTIEDLASECGVARATIRQALGVLEEERLIERYRAKGTFVIRKPQQDLWCEVSTDWSGLLTATPGATIELLTSGTRTAPAHLTHPAGELAPSYRYLRRRHWRRDEPFLVAETYIDDRLSDRIPAEDFEKKSVLRMIHDVPDLDIVDARQTLTISTADMETAALLNVAINAPVAVIRRWAIDRDGTLVYLGDGIYRGDVVRVDFKLK